MNRKLAVYLVVGSILATSTAGAIRVLGQSGPNRSSNNNQGIGPNYQPLPNGEIRLGSPAQMLNGGYGGYGVYSGMPTQPMTGNFIPNTPNMQGGKHNHAFILKKSDGTFEQIEKEPGVSFTLEDQLQANEAKQKLQNAISQVRSPDADDAKKRQSRDLIAKYLKAEFKADQESRREQVERLEKQVEQLRKQLTKRDESQDKLIELRLQLLENDAAGLSFPDSWGSLSGPQHPGGYPSANAFPTPPQYGINTGGAYPNTNSPYPYSPPYLSGPPLKVTPSNNLNQNPLARP